MADPITTLMTTLMSNVATPIIGFAGKVFCKCVSCLSTFDREAKFKKEAESMIKVGTSYTYPVNFVLNSSQAQVNICFLISNFSSKYDFRIDGGQISTLSIRSDRGHCNILSKEQFNDVVPVDKSGCSDLYVTLKLDQRQEQILKEIDSYNCEANIHFSIYVSHKNYKEEKHVSMDCLPCRIGLPQSPLVAYKQNIKTKICDACSKSIEAS